MENGRTIDQALGKVFLNPNIQLKSYTSDI